MQFKKLPIFFHRSEMFTQNPSKRFLAVEIEVAGTEGTGHAINQACAAWSASIVEDGSLPQSGFEINSSPANGDLFIAQVQEICAALNAQEAFVNTQCGLHTHIDARDFRPPSMRRLLQLYGKLEPALLRLVPPSRRGNSYCKPCGPEYLEYMGNTLLGDKPDAKTLREALALAVYKKKTVTRSDKRNKYGGERFKALNLVSWYYRGTVECRLFAGTTNASKIINWAMLWAAILDYVKAHRSPESFPAYDPKHPMDGLLRIAPTDSVKEFITVRASKWAHQLGEDN